MGVRGIGLEGVRMRSRKRSVFVYSYSGLLDAKLAMFDMHEFRLEKEKTITMYECKCRALTTIHSHHMVGFIPMHWSMLVGEI